MVFITRRTEHEKTERMRMVHTRRGEVDAEMAGDMGQRAGSERNLEAWKQ